MPQAAATPIRAPTGSDLLNTNEMRLLEWLTLTAVLTNSQIGTCSGRSEKTVRNQRTALCSKLGSEPSRSGGVVAAVGVS